MLLGRRRNVELVIKKCANCRKVQSVDRYDPSTRYEDGLLPICKRCQDQRIQAYMRAWHADYGYYPGSTKRCGTCRLVKPVADFARSRARGDGLQGRCRACCNAYARSRTRRGRDRLARGYKWCPGCETYLPSSDFFSNPYRTDRLQPYCYLCLEALRKRNAARARRMLNDQR
jgi:hypothetical protein